MLFSSDGAGIRIAVVDSGTALAETGVAIHEDGSVVDDLVVARSDGLGHGDIVGDIVSFFSPGASIISVKIFHDELTCSCEQLIRAIEWCTDNSVDIINISAGVMGECDYWEVITEACSRAFSEGITIIAARRGVGRSLPADIDGVVSVEEDLTLPVGCWRVKTDTLEVCANGYWTTLRDRTRVRSITSTGSSNACAFISGVTARLYGTHGRLLSQELLHALKKGQSFGMTTRLPATDSPTALFPVSWKSLDTLRHTEHLVFPLASVAAIPGQGIGGRLVKDVFPVDSNWIISDGYEQALFSDIEVVILDNPDDIIGSGKYVTAEVATILSWCASHRKSVVCLHPLPRHLVPCVAREFIASGTYVSVPDSHCENEMTNTEIVETRGVPLVALVGTGGICSTLGFGIALRESMATNGVIASVIGGNEYSRLFGVKPFPESALSKDSSSTLRYGLVNAFVARSRQEQCNLVLCCIPDPVIEWTAGRPHGEAFATGLETLVATRAEEVVLLINYSDPPVFVNDIITTIQVFHRANPIALVVFDLAHDPQTYRMTARRFVPVGSERMRVRADYFQQYFGIPTYAMVDQGSLAELGSLLTKMVSA